MIMKKNNINSKLLTTIITIALCTITVGCSKEPNQDIVIGESSTTTVEEEVAMEKYAFIHNNVEITPNDLVEPLVTALGSDYNYYESPSCAYIGLDKCYVYEGFSIYTYPDDKAEDHVLQVVLTDDSLSTPEGLIIGDTSEKVIELYGEDYVESDGSYAYTLGKTTLNVIIQNGTVVSIQYCYTDAL